MTQVHSVEGSSVSETYLVAIWLPNLVAFPSIRVTKGSFVGADILIGMDIINQGDFAVTNEGGISKFSFRYPSLRHIDFVEETNRERSAQAPPMNRAERRRRERK